MVGRFIEKWSDFVVIHRWFVIVTTLLGLCLLIIPMKNLYFDNSNEMWFLPDDIALVKYEKLRDLFGSSQYHVIGIEAREGEKTVFTRENLETIARLHEFLEDHEVVEKVSSLYNYQYIKAENDVLTTSDLINDLESLEGTGEEMSAMEEIMRGETLVHDYLITKDLTHTVIMAKTVYKKGEIDHQVKLIRDLNAYIDELGLDAKGYNLRFAGNPIIAENFLTTTMKDTSTTLPLMFLLTILFLWLAFRRISGILMPLVVILGSVIAAFGFVGLFGWALNSINTVLPVLLIAIGIGDSVHIIVDFYHGIDEGMESSEASRHATQNLFIPCFNTSLTTSLGFMAVASTHLRPIREFGIIAAIGVFLAFFLSVYTLPAILTFFHPKKSRIRANIHEGFIARSTNRITPATFKHKWSIVTISLCLAGVSFWYASQINVDTNFVNSFKESSKIRQDMLYFDETYNGGYSLEFILDSGIEGGIKEPGFLKEAMRFQDYLESLNNTGKANSMLNYLKNMYKVMNNDDPAFDVVPDTRPMIAQLLFLYSTSSPEEDLSDMISFDERYIRVSLRIRNIPTSQMQGMVDIIEEKLRSDFPDLTAELAGDTILWNNMSVYIQDGIITSFSIAFVAIIACFFLLFRSVKYGLFSIVPSLSPILAAGGIMGFLKIDLDFSTMMVAAICFGIAVDDTIHVMNRYIVSRRGGNTRMQSVNKAVTESGRAIIFTSLILYFGFSIMMLSSFVPNIYFGFFSGIILITALVTNLILLPAIMFLTGDKK
jgi:uncharacterized protein